MSKSRLGATRSRRSISEKLNWLVLISVAVAVTLVTGVMAWRDGRRETGLEIDRLSSAAKVLASFGQDAAAHNDRQRAYLALRSITLMPDVEYVRIERANGSLIAETGAGVRLTNDVIAGNGAARSFLAQLRSGTAQVSAPIVHDHQVVGRVVLLGRTGDGGVRLTSSLILSLAAGLAAALVGLLVSRRLQRGITRPLVELTQAMSEIRERHDYSLTAQIAADDEVADLVDGFNEMLCEIRHRDAAIASHLAGLEQTVAERTADLKLAKEAAESANSAKSDFLATMSHEIRTPMNGIMVMAEMLAAGELAPKPRRFAEVIAKSGSSLLSIINDILDFSKIEAGKLELEKVPTDPAEIVEDVLSLFWERANSKGLDLAAYIDPATPRLILGDPTRLRQVIGNLVNNAIKFTETGGVFVEVRPDRGGLHLAVCDTGIGIAKDKIGDLFEAFTQAEAATTRRFGGTGLGLTISKRIVGAMGGEIRVTSRVGRGSTFAVNLPLDVVAAAEPWPVLPGAVAALAIAGVSTRAALGRYLGAAGFSSSEDAAQPSLTISDPAGLKAGRRSDGAIVCIGEFGDSRPQALFAAGLADLALVKPLRRCDLVSVLRAIQQQTPLRDCLDDDIRLETSTLPSFAGRRVLVADDSAVNREVAIEALSRLGVVCTVVSDGIEAVDGAFREIFDAVLMDGSMPGMDGYEAAEAIRKRESAEGRAPIPIIALTANVVGTAADRWRTAGMDGVLHKPFTLSALAATLGQFMLCASPAEGAQNNSAEPVKARPSAPIPIAASATVSDLLDPDITAQLTQMAADGKGAFVERVRRLYRENSPAATTALVEAAARGDAEATARAAHALKSMSLSIGAIAVAHSAGEIERDARELKRVDHNRAQALHRLLLATLDVLEGQRPDVAAAEDANASDEQALMSDLGRAIEAGQLSLAYQAQYDRDGIAVSGVEALIRWNHPKRGFVSPAVFIPLAERQGLIRPITRWVIEQAMAETKELDGLVVSFNASAVEFSDATFVDEIALLVRRHGFDPRRLEVEVTETAVLAGEDMVRLNIDRLHALGMKVALDDFGVGYSSLSHLRNFAFDKLKIDRAFVIACAETVQSATLVHAVVAIGRALGMKVVAEGVETEAQHKFLKLAGAHAMQGYLFAKPEPIAALKARLATAGPGSRERQTKQVAAG